MRIAQVAPLYESVPPATYGGTERVVAALSVGLARRGHEVTLFGAGPCALAGIRYEQMLAQPLRHHMTRDELAEIAPHYHLAMLAEVYRRAEEFDIIHSHCDLLTLPFVSGRSTPTVVTMHGRLDLEVVRHVLTMHPEVPLVSISEHQRHALRDVSVRWAATVYNGLDLSHYAPKAAACRTSVAEDGYLAFVGRIHPDKGPETALAVSQAAGRELRIAAKVDPFDVDYFDEAIAPLLCRDGVQFVGEISESQKPAFFAGAAATLFPSAWPEPFGLVMIESLAAGTPVIALRHGAVPEILVDGVTGFVCDTATEMTAAVARIGEIDRSECVRRAMQFSAERMSEGYEQVFRTALRTAPLVRKNTAA